MEDHEVQTSPQIYARIGGVLYLIIIIIGTLGEAAVRNTLIVSGDATATPRGSELRSFCGVSVLPGTLLLMCAVA